MRKTSIAPAGVAAPGAATSAQAATGHQTIDPNKPTIVLTHGWNPLPNKIHTTFACAGANELKCRCGDSYNILSWDWNAVRVSPFRDEPLRIGKCQGRMMAAAEICISLTGDPDLLLGHRLDPQGERGDQAIQLAARPRIGLIVGDDPCLQEVGGRHPGHIRPGDRSGEVLRLRLPEENRQERGGIHDHERGRPRSSYRTSP